MCDTQLEMAAGALARPTIAFCETRKRLLESVGEAVSELAALQSEHLQAIIRGEPEFQEFADRIRKATVLKEKWKRAFLTHVQEHGC